MRFLACTFLAIGGYAWAQSAPQNPFVNDPKAAEAGRGMFRIYCSPCHGVHAQGGRGPDLTRGSFHGGDRDEDLYRGISAGVEGTEMPAFGGQGDEAVWRFVAYIRSVSRRSEETVRGDAASGEKVYWGKGGCGACHRIGQRGGRMGPDLTRAGRSRSLRYLRESLLEPSADITPGFATVRVVTREGRRIEGIERNFDNFSTQFMDASETIHSFLRDDVKSLERDTRSLMPADYGKRLSTGEIDHLVAYLASLGAKEK